MSIFDRFAAKEAGEQKTGSFFPAPSRKTFLELETAAEEAKEQYPNDGKAVDGFVRTLTQAYRSRRKKMQEAGQKPLKAEAHFFLAEDRLSAFACVFPPENGGDGISAEELLKEMLYEEIGRAHV